MIEFAKIFIPVAASLIVLLIAGGVKLRDMILRQNRELEWLQKDLTALEENRKNDRIEHNTLKTMAASMDAKIDSKVSEVIRGIEQQRHEDSKQFTQALSEMRETLGKINTTLDYIKSDVNALKGAK